MAVGEAPRSIAHGILDDETYDWVAVVEGMLKTGGWPLVVDEDRLVDANAFARERPASTSTTPARPAWPA